MERSDPLSRGKYANVNTMNGGVTDIILFNANDSGPSFPQLPCHLATLFYVHFPAWTKEIGRTTTRKERRIYLVVPSKRTTATIFCLFNRIVPKNKDLGWEA